MICSTLSPTTTLLVKSENIHQLFWGTFIDKLYKPRGSVVKPPQKPDNKSSSHYSPRNIQEILSYVRRKLRNTIICKFVQAESINIFSLFAGLYSTESSVPLSEDNCVRIKNQSSLPKGINIETIHKKLSPQCLYAQDRLV